MPEPPCSFEREAASDAYTCGKDHCPRCGSHKVYEAPGEGTLRCQLMGSCQVSLGVFA